MLNINRYKRDIRQNIGTKKHKLIIEIFEIQVFFFVSYLSVLKQSILQWLMLWPRVFLFIRVFPFYL